jgi:hypothetical protein
MKKYGIWAVRSANSIFGAAVSWCKKNGQVVTFDSKEEADIETERMNKLVECTPNVSYYTKEMTECSE